MVSQFMSGKGQQKAKHSHTHDEPFSIKKDVFMAQNVGICLHQCKAVTKLKMSSCIDLAEHIYIQECFQISQKNERINC